MIGMNPIFGQRMDEEVRFEKRIADRLRQKLQRPDAIFGLRQTRNIEALLYDTRKRHLSEDNDPRQIHEILDPNPFEQHLGERDPLLFPFLVVEAKSATSASDWYSVNL